MSRLDVEVPQHVGQLVEVRIHQFDGQTFKPAACPLEHRCVLVEADQTAGAPDPLGDQLCMPAAANRAIHPRLSRLRVAQLKHLRRKDRHVPRLRGHTRTREAGQGERGQSLPY
jgi:hypothetical protein